MLSKPHWWNHFLCGSSLQKEENHYTFRTNRESTG